MNGKFFHVNNFNKGLSKALKLNDEDSWEALKAEFFKAVNMAVTHLNASSSQVSLPLSHESQPLSEEQPLSETPPLSEEQPLSETQPLSEEQPLSETQPLSEEQHDSEDEEPEE